MLRVNPITPVLREVCWALHSKAKELRRFIGDPRYRMALNISIEDSVENLVPHDPKNIVYVTQREPVPSSTHQHRGYPKEVLDRVREQMSRYNMSTLLDLSREMIPVRSEFRRELAPLTDKVTNITALIDNPEVFAQAGIFREEAIMLAEIFSVLALEVATRVSVSTVCGPQGPMTIVDTPEERIFDRASKFFIGLAKKLPSFEGDKQTTNVALQRNVSCASHDTASTQSYNSGVV